jgi:hypothetical protein
MLAYYSVGGFQKLFHVLWQAEAKYAGEGGRACHGVFQHFGGTKNAGFGLAEVSLVVAKAPNICGLMFGILPNPIQGRKLPKLRVLV